MVWDLKDKMVVITGGAEGMGYNIAEKYLQKCIKIVILLDINEELGNEATKNLTSKYGKDRAIFLKCDITTDSDAVLNEILLTHKVDILVNNAGIGDETIPRRLIDVNLTSLIECSLKLWEYMRKDKGGNGGTIINISSIYGIRITSYFPIYHASKYGVTAFTKSLGHSVNFERSGVRVVAICPGITDTNILLKTKGWLQTPVEELRCIKKSLLPQKADAVGDAAVEVYERANSGTVWKIEGAQPIVDVTNKSE